MDTQPENNTIIEIGPDLAASKAKGMWMGGNPPLGYRPDGRTLAIVEEHADLIRDIFRRNRAIGNVRLLAQELVEESISVPIRTAITGRQFGGVAFTRGQLYKVLANPIYIGEIHHRGQAHKGQHPPIIEREIWNDVQASLAGTTAASMRQPTYDHRACLLV